MDKFPEAFYRFEEVVNVRYIRSYTQLKLSFERWAGEKWKDSPRQNIALKREARRLGIPVREYGGRGYYRAEHRRSQDIYVVRQPVVKPYRFETVTVRGHLQSRWRDKRTGRFIKKPQ